MKRVVLFLIFIIMIGPVSAGIIVYNSLIPPAKEAIRGIRPVPDEVEYWQTPHETKVRGKGDCEDFSALIAERYYELGISFRMVIIETRGGPHMVLQVGAVYVDPIQPKIMLVKNYKVIKTYTYKEFQKRLG